MNDNKVIAREVLKLATRLRAYDESDIAIKSARRIVASLKEMQGKMKEALSERVKVQEELDAKAKDAQKAVKDGFKEYDKESHYTDAVKSSLEELEALSQLNGDVTAVCKDAGVELNKKSIQPAYKELFDILLSVCDDSTFRKFAERIDAFKKNTSTLKSGLAALDVGIKDWSPEMKALYQEQGKALPKASVNLTAGFGDVVKNLGAAVKRVFAKCISIFRGLFKSCAKNAVEIDGLDEKIRKIRK